MVPKYETKTQKLVDDFSTLASYVEKLAFPSYREGVLSPQDTQGWGKIRRTLYRITHSTFSINNPNLWNVVLYLIWAYSSAASFAFGIVFIQPSIYNLNIPNIQPYSLVHDTTTLVFTTILVILILPIAIYWWYEVITENRYPLILKIFLVGLFFYLLFEVGRKLEFNNVTIGSWFDLKSGLLRSFSLHFAPSITYLMAIGFDALISIYYLLKVIFGGVRSIHDPLPFREIKKLLLEDIPIENSNETLCMSKLTFSEVQAISKWASANRDATEKRTIPISIVLGLTGLITISGFIQSKTDTIISEWFRMLSTIYSSPFSLPVFTIVFDVGLFFIFVAFVILILMSLVRLFMNLAVQSIIIETCIAVQYGKEKNNK